MLVYPAPFVVERERQDALGLAHAERRVLAGESWDQGRVILSWSDVLEGAADPHDGRNVVIHEFAHQLDQANGATNGAPWLPGRARRERWAAVMSRAYAEFQQRVERGEPGVLDPYAAHSPAEFFAVLSELFVERPHELAEHHPALYPELHQLYGVDPRLWSPAGARLGETSVRRDAVRY